MKRLFDKEDPSTYKYNSEKLAWTAPSDEIACHSCVYRLRGELGFRNGYCEKYPNSTPGKPRGVLFGGATCEFYQHE